MSKYKFTYFLNTACAERRPQTRRDLQEDWIVEEKEYPTALEAFEHAYIEILDNDEEALQDLYEENGIGPDDGVKKLEALKNDFDCIDPGDGSTILISIEGEGPVDSYDSGFTKESFNDDYMEDDDYDDDYYLDENKKLNEVDSKNKSVTLIKNNEHPCRYWHKGAPCFKYGKYEWYPEVINNRIDRSELEQYSAFETTEDDFAISEITPKITIDEFNKLITPEMEQEYVKLLNQFESNQALNELDESEKLKEDEQLEINEKGLPVLEHPYSLRKRNDDRFQITSSHPYDMTEYSYAISKNNDINSDWNVYDPENPRTIVSDYSAKKTTLEGTYKGWNKTLDVMKRIDSNKKRRIDRT